MGCGEGIGWNLTDYPAHQCFTRFFSALQHCYLEQPALYRGDYDARSFAWQEQPEAVGPRACVFQYRRGAGETALQVGLNFSAQEQWLTCPRGPRAMRLYFIRKRLSLVAVALMLRRLPRSRCGGKRVAVFA